MRKFYQELRGNSPGKDAETNPYGNNEVPLTGSTLTKSWLR